LFVRVLGYREDGEWVALALEMDVRGYGDTFEAALQELRELVDTQVAFALHKGQPEMIWRNAEAEYFDRFEAAWHDALAALVSGHNPHQDESAVTALPIPPAHVIDNLKSTFSRTSA
jgi:hypothetical protein